MNILIVGGLLGLAVVAILGAVLLGVGEDRAEKAQKAQQTASTALLPQQSQSRQQESQEIVAQSVPATPILSRPTTQLPSLNEAETLSSLNGQAHEITSELRALALRAGELERRLTILSETLERQRPLHAVVPEQFYTTEAETQSL